MIRSLIHSVAAEVAAVLRAGLTAAFGSVTVSTVNGVEIYTGSGDPTSGGGQAATRPALYLRTGTDEIYYKNGAADTAWNKVGPNRFIVGPWMAPNMAASQTNSTTMGPSQNSTMRTFRAHRAMKVLSATAWLNTVNATPAGSVTLTVFKNNADPGVAYDLTLTPSGASDQGAYTTFATAMDLAAGDYVDVRWTTTADWNSTNGDVIVWLEVEG